MANSINIYTVTAAQETSRQFAINFTLGYLSRDHVVVFVDGELDGGQNQIFRTFTFVNDALVQLDDPILEDEVVNVRRDTPSNILFHDFQAGAIINEQGLDESNLQTIMLVHEVFDGRNISEFTEDLNLNGKFINNMADPELAQDAATKAYVDNNKGIWRLDWVTATAYNVTDIVRDPVTLSIYIATAAHTSGVFLDDSANWDKIIDFADSAESAGLRDTRYGPIFATSVAMVAANPVALDGVAVDLVSGMSVEIQGYTTAGDSGAGRYIVEAGDTSDGFSRLLLDNGNTAVLQPAGSINALSFGINGTGIEKDKLEALWLFSEQTGLPVIVTGALESTSSVLAQRDSYTEKNITNLLPNSRFNWWRRFDARGISNIPYVAPTFGDAATYDGTGGLRVYGPDMWHGKMFGTLGSGTLTRVRGSGAARKSTDSEHFMRWAATSFVPPASVFDFSPTNITSFAVSPVVVSQVAHGLSNGAFVWWDNASYNGGSFTDSTFTVSNVTADTYELVITPDAGFTSWISFGDMTDDPDAKGFQHIHDPVLGADIKSWVRNGTAGQEINCRRPLNRASGRYTCRIRGKHVSGNGEFFPRIFQNMGSGGSTNTSTTLPGIDFAADGGGVKEFVLPITLPDLAALSFGGGSYLQLSLASANPELSHEIEISEIDLYEGDNLLQRADTDHYKELPLLERFYRTERVDFGWPAVAGRFYSLPINFDAEPMAGVPTLTLINEDTVVTMAFSSLGNITKYGLSYKITATSTSNFGQYVARVELEYDIPTSFVGD
jgi:hypothetical protein